MARPTEYDPAYCEQVIEWGKKGKSKTWIAANLDCTRQTLENWANANPEFLDALTRAMVYSQLWWEDAGQVGMTGYKFNASVWSRSMAARFPDDWREVKARDHFSSDGSMSPKPTRINLVAKHK